MTFYPHDIIEEVSFKRFKRLSKKWPPKKSFSVRIVKFGISVFVLIVPKNMLVAG